MFFSCTLVVGQKRLGKTYFKAGRYQDALTAWKNVRNLDRDKDILALRGIAYYNTHQPLLCIQDMAMVYKKKPGDIRSLKYAAMSYMTLYDYKEASRFFKVYLNALKPGDKDYDWTIHQIRRCGLAINYMYKEPVAFVENLLEPVNTAYDELKPVISPTQSGRLYFSSNREGSTGGLRNEEGFEDKIRGQYHFDMYQTQLNDGRYEKPGLFLPLLNGPKHDILQAISPDGQTAYYLKSDYLNGGILYADTFRQNHVKGSPSQRADLPLDTENGDRDLFWVNDSLILFASKRTGGYGGYDLYFCQNVGGQWQKPRNLGRNINTPFNEISPFLVSSGDILFFSTDKTETLGGFDVFKSYFREEEWTAPVSLHFPVNSSRDDIDFVISPDGSYGLFSSNRTQAISGYDIFICFFNEPVYEQLEKVRLPEFAFIQEEPEVHTSVAGPSQQGTEKVTTATERFFMSKTLTFEDNEITLNPRNYNILKTLADVLQIYPDVDVLLISHTAERGNNYTDMFFSIKRAEVVASELSEKLRISPERVHFLGCGSDFPYHKSTGKSSQKTFGQNNNRIEILLINETYPGLHVSYDFVQGKEKSNNWERLHEVLKGLFYKIELGESYFPMNYNIIVEDPSLVTIEKIADGPYPYYYGIFKDIKSARESGVDGRIVPFYKGKRISKDDIQNWVEKFPELKNIYD
jgi:outer membrane protein OmpA-like peptidoglycan-associated protein/tetratricopeptide (TPR) repeat protein